MYCLTKTTLINLQGFWTTCVDSQTRDLVCSTVVSHDHFVAFFGARYLMDPLTDVVQLFDLVTREGRDVSPFRGVLRPCSRSLLNSAS